ncbi:MAG: hypothetical protein AAF810_01290 [Cyanobacteria bacterium P01_D01_bin.36]
MDANHCLSDAILVVSKALTAQHGGNPVFPDGGYGKEAQQVAEALVNSMPDKLDKATSQGKTAKFT